MKKTKTVPRGWIELTIFPGERSIAVNVAAISAVFLSRDYQPRTMVEMIDGEVYDIVLQKISAIGETKS